MTSSILVVEDEPAIRELLRVNLVDAGYEVRAAPDAESAQRELARTLPSLLLLDWMLPGKSGLALAKELRGDARMRDLPIIMLTARTDEADKVAGLEAWVDDYVTKPFSPRELKARIKSVLRRQGAGGGAGAADGRRAAARSGYASRDRRRESGSAGTDRVPAAALSARAPGARPYARAAARSGLGRRCLHRGAHGGRPHPAPAAGARAVRAGRADRDGARQRLPARCAPPALTRSRDVRLSPVVVAGVGAPLAVIVLAALAGLSFGAIWGFVVLVVGLGAVIGFHLWQVDRLMRWSDAPLDAPVPEAGGAWGLAFSALYRRVRTRTLHHRDLTTTIERFRSAVEALPDGMVIVDAANRILWANARAQEHLGLDLTKDTGRPLLNLLRQPRGRPLLRGRRFHRCRRRRIAARDGNDAVDPGRAVRRRRAPADQPRTSRNSKLSPGCAAISSPTSRTSSRRR